VTDANELLSSIHDRMPVLLNPDDYRSWLDPGTADAEALRSLLKPYPAGEMEAVPVSWRVNSPKTDESSLLDSVDTT
jgi:putative SOS response-associated peptidase YedK